MQNKHLQMAFTTVAIGLSALAQAGTVNIITSFPKELTDAYKKAFEAKHPSIKLEILNNQGDRAGSRSSCFGRVGWTQT